jgi:hypothetical protein
MDYSETHRIPWKENFFRVITKTIPILSCEILSERSFDGNPKSPPPPSGTKVLWREIKDDAFFSHLRAWWGWLVSSWSTRINLFAQHNLSVYIFRSSSLYLYPKICQAGCTLWFRVNRSSEYCRSQENFCICCKFTLEVSSCEMRTAK